MTRAALLFLLVLSACAAPQSPDEAACERQADNDPAVRELIIKGAGNPHFMMESQDELRAAKRAATVRCLKSRGILQQSGVEAQKPLK